MSVGCSQAEVSMMGRSLVQRTIHTCFTSSLLSSGSSTKICMYSSVPVRATLPFQLSFIDLINLMISREQ